jgi:hypothetical protein
MNASMLIRYGTGIMVDALVVCGWGMACFHVLRFERRESVGFNRTKNFDARATEVKGGGRK